MTLTFQKCDVGWRFKPAFCQRHRRHVHAGELLRRNSYYVARNSSSRGLSWRVRSCRPCRGRKATRGRVNFRIQGLSPKAYVILEYRPILYLLVDWCLFSNFTHLDRVLNPFQSTRFARLMVLKDRRLLHCSYFCSEY